MFAFYNREKEREALKNIYNASKENARFTYITGPRRVGKTTLVEDIYRDQDNYFYLFVSRKTEYSLCKEFYNILKSKIKLIQPFADIESMLEFIFEYSKREHITVVFDEFQNFDYVNPAVFSILQKIWDKNKNTSKINLITIGSLYSSMEKIFSSKHEPLYGRTTGKIEIKPFKPKVIYKILSDYNVTTFDKVLNFYSLFNGVPKYYEFLYLEKLFSKNIGSVFQRLFLNIDSRLRTEGRDLLVEEFGPDYQRYFTILEAIAMNNNITNNKISSYTGINSNDLSTYLSRLNNTFNVITRVLPVIGGENRKGRYAIKDNLLKVWFRYLFSHQSFLESGDEETILEIFNKDFSTLKGKSFENLVIDIIRTNIDKFYYTELGNFWDKNVEIDILALNKREKTALIGECKLKYKSFDLEVYRKKVEYILEKYLKGYKVEKVLFVSEEIRDLGDIGVKVYGGKELVGLLDGYT